MQKNSKTKKGQELEIWLSDQIREIGLDNKAGRSKRSGAGTGEKADVWTSLTICGRNAGIECKNQNTPHISQWWEQTQKLEKLGREPILIYKLEGENYGETKAVIYASTLLELIKASKTPQEIAAAQKVGYIDNGRRALIWAVKTAISALKKVISELEKLEK